MILNRFLFVSFFFLFRPEIFSHSFHKRRGKKHKKLLLVFARIIYYSFRISFRFIRKWRPRQCSFPEIQNSRYVNLKIDYYWQKIVFPWRECVNGIRVAKRETIARVSILVRLGTARNRFLFTRYPSRESHSSLC